MVKSPMITRSIKIVLLAAFLVFALWTKPNGEEVCSPQWRPIVPNVRVFCTENNSIIILMSDDGKVILFPSQGTCGVAAPQIKPEYL